MAVGASAGALAFCSAEDESNGGHTVVNWSGTHEVVTSQYAEPETVEELETLVAAAQSEGRAIRPVGSALSPNGVGFSAQGMVGLAQVRGAPLLADNGSDVVATCEDTWAWLRMRAFVVCSGALAAHLLVAV